MPDERNVYFGMPIIVDPDQPENVVSFTGMVMDAGGGRVDILVSGDTMEYPEIGARVTVTVTVEPSA